MVGSGEDEESTVGDWEERREERERDEVCLGVGRVCTMSLSLSFPKEG